MAIAQRIEEELWENKTTEWYQSLGDSALAWHLAKSGALREVNAEDDEKKARLANIMRRDNYFLKEFVRLWDVEVKRKKPMLDINLFRLSTCKMFPYRSGQFVLRHLVEMASHHPNSHRTRLNMDDTTFLEVAHGLVDIFFLLIEKSGLFMNEEYTGQQWQKKSCRSISYATRWLPSYVDNPRKKGRSCWCVTADDGPFWRLAQELAESRSRESSNE